MSISMSAQEIEDFLSDGHTARIATVKPNNSPHVTPVWYLWEKNQLLMTIPKDSVKARNIRRNNKVAVTIDTDKPPIKAVIIEGTAKILLCLSARITRGNFLCMRTRLPSWLVGLNFSILTPNPNPKQAK